MGEGEIYGGYAQGVKSAATVKWAAFIRRSFQTKTFANAASFITSAPNVVKRDLIR